MTYLITYLYYGEPTEVICEEKNGKFWINDTVSVPEEVIIRREKKDNSQQETGEELEVKL